MTSTPVDFAQRRAEASQAGLLPHAGEYLKLKEGPNRLRLLTDCLAHPGEYQGRKTFKWLCYVVDRTDGRVKPFFMPPTIYKRLEALQQDPDYLFSTVPMPYDITVHATKAGTKEVEYSVVPARHETPVTAEEAQELGRLKPLTELQALLRAKPEATPTAAPPVSRVSTPLPPAGFDAWWARMQTLARQGFSALEQAWGDTRVTPGVFKAYATRQQRAAWEALKSDALKVGPR